MAAAGKAPRGAFPAATRLAGGDNFPNTGGNTNIKRFDKLTTLSQVEGQITMTEIQNIKQCFDLFVKSLPSCYCERSEAISINLCL